ncbi:MAG: DNA topoisomerase IB [Acidobacteriota bacterium]|nr:DNA topoisomerase IB [Acidobacteriota bacterium]
MAVSELKVGEESGSLEGAIVTDPVASARAAGLRYVTDDAPGIRRRRSGKGFTYLDPQGKVIRDPRERRRIDTLAIPPAWTGVWICPRSNGHLQATGRDARGRKQHRYHPDWRAVRDQTKFSRMVAFGEALPGIRGRVEADLRRPGLPREKVLAAVVRLLETTLIRIGNKEYAKQNRSFGLTTLRNRHVDISGAKVRFEFRGKSGKEHSVEIQDRRLARVIKQCRDLPGHELFQYLDEEGARQTISSDDVNEYLREATGEEFSAKDFRTWGGTVLALAALAEAECGDSEREAQKAVVEAVKRVSQELGNRPAVCRKYYVHPAVIEAFLSGRLPAALGSAFEAAPEGEDDAKGGGLRRLERQTLGFLRGCS